MRVCMCVRIKQKAVALCILIFISDIGTGVMGTSGFEFHKRVSKGNAKQFVREH